MACRDLSKQSLSAAGLLTALTFQAAAVQVTVQVPASSLERWRRMCREEQQDEGSLLSGLITTRQELLDAEIVPRPVATGVPTASSSEAGSCGRFGYQSPDDAKDIFSFARTELDCPEIFMKAVVIYGRHLLSQKRLHEFDILHEVIRAEPGQPMLTGPSRFAQQGLAGPFGFNHVSSLFLEGGSGRPSRPSSIQQICPPETTTPALM
ncbi:unnamed protein product [Durusdinium trenchii]|uniref:Uncharacterized protein n=1 Tax=Durusdinium trenchii TaxID=1381693 RepID=A0ABP0I899_9DINO